MRITSFLCLLAVAACATSREPATSYTVEAAWTGAGTGDAIALLGASSDEDTFASTAFTAMECRAYAHIRDNVVSKLESRRIKGRCNFDELRHRDA